MKVKKKADKMNILRHDYSPSLWWVTKLQIMLIAIFAIVIVSTDTVYAQKKPKPKKHKKHKLPYLSNIKTAEEISEIYNKFDRFKYQIMGHFSNKDQVESGATFDPLQEFVIMPVFQNRPNEFWVYIEFFSPELLDQPVDQRIEQYKQVSRDTFLMVVYYIKEENQSKYVNAWRHAEFPETNIRKDLIRDEGCDLLIAHQKSNPGTYKTVKPEDITCEMLNAKGAARYVDMEFELSDNQYNMWFHFYDQDKEHLKKTNKKGLIFRRLKEKEMSHMWAKH